MSVRGSFGSWFEFADLLAVVGTGLSLRCDFLSWVGHLASTILRSSVLLWFSLGLYRLLLYRLLLVLVSCFVVGSSVVLSC